MPVTLRFEQLLRQFVIRSEMQVSEEQLAFAHARILRRDRLFHFHDHLGAGPNLVSRIDDRRAGAFVKCVFKARTFARARLDHDLVAGIFERAHTGGRQSDSIFVVFDFFRQTDNHSLFSRVSEMLMR